MAELAIHPQHDDAVVHYVNQLLQAAIQQRISDIHIEPFQNHCRIRFRCDGVLQEFARITPTLAQRIVVRLKIMAQLNITERRLPQDGHLTLSMLEARISTCPTLFGEKIVLRLQPNITQLFSLEQLGMTKEQLHAFNAALNLPQGLILVTGPTGSGKTMTLYAALQFLNKITRNIVTIEDPIEVTLPDINQVNLQSHFGLDFPNVLKFLLRQDPDIIMVGEIRDLETAQLALQAAQTGHLVLATLHTNSVNASLARLHALGIAEYFLKDAITLVLSQRLLRCICSSCHGAALNCEHCHQGYRGRIGVFELLIPGSNKKMMSLRDAAHLKIQEGLTDEKELQRILGNMS